MDGHRCSGKNEEKGLVFDIERYAIHDGPGIRTTVFTKGCPLKCVWCANPEGISHFAELMFLKERCIGCNDCIEACPQKAISRDKEGHLVTDRERCLACGTCSVSCSAKARHIAGKRYSVAEVLSVVERDALFYKKSGGGITISGGCPTSQPQFTLRLLEESKARGLHTAIETCGFSSWRNLRKILEHVDHVYYDIKCMASAEHRQWTGAPNELVLSNAKKTSVFCFASGKAMIVRIPVIPGYTNSETNVCEIVRFVVEELKAVELVELMPYHRLGAPKYGWLGKEYALQDVLPLDSVQSQRLMCAAVETAKAAKRSLRIEIQ